MVIFQNSFSTKKNCRRKRAWHESALPITFSSKCVFNSAITKKKMRLKTRQKIAFSAKSRFQAWIKTQKRDLKNATQSCVF